MDPAMAALMGPPQGADPGMAMGGAPPMGAPAGPPTPAEAAIQALMGLAPQQQQEQAMLTQQQQQMAAAAAMQALMGAPDPRAMSAISGPVAPGSLDAAGAMGSQAADIGSVPASDPSNDPAMAGGGY